LLEVNVLWMPLLGAGVASLSPGESLQGIGGAIRATADRINDLAGNLTIVIVIYRERLLPRYDVANILTETLKGDFESQPCNQIAS